MDTMIKQVVDHNLLEFSYIFTQWYRKFIFKWEKRILTVLESRQLGSRFKWRYVIWKRNIPTDARSVRVRVRKGTETGTYPFCSWRTFGLLPSLSTYKPCCINILVHVLRYTCAKVGLLGRLVCVFSSLLNIATCFCRVAVLVYPPAPGWVPLPRFKCSPVEWGEISLGKNEEAGQGKAFGAYPRSSDFIWLPWKASGDFGTGDKMQTRGFREVSL